MAVLDEAIARASRLEHERDTWQERATKAEAELKALKASKRPAIFDEQSIAERIYKMEQLSVTATLRQEVLGLWGRIAGLEVQLREAKSGQDKAAKE